MRLNQPDKGMRSIAGYGDEIRLPACSRLHVAYNARVGRDLAPADAQFGRESEVLLHQDFR